MIYPYQCRQCKKMFDVIKSVADIDKPETCECGAIAERYIVAAMIGSVEKGHYNPAFGKYIRNKHHLRNETDRMRDQGRDIIPVGDEPPEKIYKKLETERETRIAKRWDVSAEQLLSEA